MRTVRHGDLYTVEMDQEEKMILLQALSIAEADRLKRSTEYYIKATLRKTSESEMYMDWSRQADVDRKDFVRVCNALGKVEYR